MRVSVACKRIWSVVILSAVLAGCANLGGSRAIDSAAGGDPSITPFRLDILEERNDGETLVINGRIIPKTSWSGEDVLVRLSAVTSAGEQKVSFHKVKDVVPSGARLASGEPQAFSLTLPSSEVSNYQLEVLWGRDAAPYMDSTKAALKQTKGESEFLALRNLEVHRVPDGSCSSPEECLVKFSIKGEFFNSGRALIRDVVLVAGFSPADKLDLPNQILENERRIEVRNLGLGSGATKPFRLTLEKYVPASDQVAYQPVVRIASFDSE